MQDEGFKGMEFKPRTSLNQKNRLGETKTNSDVRVLLACSSGENPTKHSDL